MLYHFFRLAELEGVIIYTILLLVLLKLFPGTGRGNMRVKYLSSGFLGFFAIYYGTYLLPFSGHPHPYWMYFVICMGIPLISSHFFLDGIIYEKFTYILFYVSFIQLYKMVCSPLYSLEGIISDTLYQSLDITTNLILILLMLLIAYFFVHYPLKLTKGLMNPRFFLITLFPVVLLVYYGITLLDIPFGQIYKDALIALIILCVLPAIYFMVASLTRSFDEQRKLDRALTDTQAQIFRYRYSLELEERIKKERHELKNNYLYIRSLLEKRQLHELEEYLDNEIGEKMDELSAVSTGNTMIDYLVNRKIAEAQKKHIRIYTEILLPKDISIDEDRFSTIFLNIINNAIEACEGIEKPDIHISLKCIKNYFCCEVSNKTNPDKILGNPQLNTTKKDKENHGLGLKIVKETIDECNGIFKTELKGNYFWAKVMIPMDVE
jgi:signal transduction histidine kinase